jgi:hypothetical protein
VKGSADDSYHGQKVKCPKCNGIFPAITPITETPPQVQTQATPFTEQSADTPSVKPVVEEDNVPASTDIVPEMDTAMAEDAIRDKEEDVAPAMFDDFFEADAPIADNIGQLEGKQREEEPVEAAAPSGEAVPGDDAPSPLVTPPLFSDEPVEERGAEKFALDGVENQPYGMDKEQCWQCGKKDSVGAPFIAKDGRLYCPDCFPAAKPEPGEVSPTAADPRRDGAGRTDDSPREPRYGFTIGDLLKEAWAKTTGAKATVWAASAVMYLALLVLFACGAFLLPSPGDQPGGMNIAGILADVLFQLISNAVSVIFTAGLIFIGIRKVAGETIGWKMIFEGFPVAGKLIVAALLQTLLVGIGFLLLILPGIYLAVGYAMTVPLIVDRKMSPWQAMEASRKAIHGEWWKLFGLFLVVGLIFMVSALPLGLGLIWTWPMFVVLGGLVYRALFGIEKRFG